MIVMQSNAKIAVLGGDMRQAALCRRLSENGFETAAWGLGNADIGGAVKCHDWHSALEKCQAVILPLPAFKDGKYVVADTTGNDVISLSQLLYAMPPKALLLGGKFDDVVKKSATHHGVELIDYFCSEKMQILNAILTSEGALEVLLRELPISIFKSKILVCGYGRIGRILSKMIKDLGAKVYVSARKESDLAYIESDGNFPVETGSELFVKAAVNADAIINTVPANIINKSVLERIERCRLIVDLASGNGGVDFDAAKKFKIKSIHALALPGKTAPESAGEILAECVLDMLLKRE